MPRETNEEEEDTTNPPLRWVSVTEARDSPPTLIPYKVGGGSEGEEETKTRERGGNEDGSDAHQQARDREKERAIDRPKKTESDR